MDQTFYLTSRDLLSLESGYRSNSWWAWRDIILSCYRGLIPQGKAGKSSSVGLGCGYDFSAEGGVTNSSGEINPSDGASKPSASLGFSHTSPIPSYKSFPNSVLTFTVDSL